MSSDGTHYNHDPFRGQYPPPPPPPPETTWSTQSSSNAPFHLVVPEPSSAVLRDSSHSYPPPSGGPGGFVLPNHSNEALNAQYPQGNRHSFSGLDRTQGSAGQSRPTFDATPLSAQDYNTNNYDPQSVENYIPVSPENYYQSKLSQIARPPLQYSQDSGSLGQSSQTVPPSPPETEVLVKPEPFNSYGRPVPENEKESYRPLQPEQPAVRPSYQGHCNNPAITGCGIFVFLVACILTIGGIVMMVCSKVIKEHCYSVCGVVDTDSNNCDAPNCNNVAFNGLFYSGVVAVVLGAPCMIVLFVRWSCCRR